MEVLGHAVGATANELAIHSMAVMDRFSNGEAYNEAVWIERGRFAVRQTIFKLFSVNCRLISSSSSDRVLSCASQLR